MTWHVPSISSSVILVPGIAVATPPVLLAVAQETTPFLQSRLLMTEEVNYVDTAEDQADGMLEWRVVADAFEFRVEATAPEVHSLYPHANGAT